MKPKWFLIAVVIGAIVTAAVFLWPHKPISRSRLFVGDRPIFLKGDAIWEAANDRLEDIHQSCPEIAFVSQKDQADYSLQMFWDKNHWRAMLTGNDELFFMESSPDFNKILRDTCKAIRKAKEWPPTPAHPVEVEKKNILLDRYELHDLRNGNMETSALLDKQTGKVWVWRISKSRETYFSSEDVSPEPENQ